MKLSGKKATNPNINKYGKHHKKIYEEAKRRNIECITAIV